MKVKKEKKSLHHRHLKWKRVESDTGEVQQDENKFDEPEVKTADALNERLQSLINDEGVDNIYVELPKLNLDTLIA